MGYEKSKLIEEIVKIILKHAKPTRIYLYGSQVNGEVLATSDIDIAYDDKDFRNDYLIKNEINELKTLIKIDVQNISRCDDRFTNGVKSMGKVLYSATKRLRAEDGLYNFSNALNRFINVVDRKMDFKEDGFEDIYLDIIVKRFEFTYEMAWKSLRRYLSFLGIELRNPREIFKEAYSQDIIKKEDVWLDMIEQRNLSSHIYDENEISEMLNKKDKYKEAFIELKEYMSKELSSSFL